jgi:hypothetical protein
MEMLDAHVCEITVHVTVGRQPTVNTSFLHLLLPAHACSATGTAEQVTARERQEISDFLEAVMDTRPMRYCHALLVAMVRSSRTGRR